MSKVWDHLAKLLPGHENRAETTEAEPQKKKCGKYIQGEMIADADHIRDLIELAVGQRTQVQLELIHNKKRYTFVCQTMLVAQEGMVLVYETAGKRIPLVPGLKVTVHFQIVRCGKTLFYAFSSIIKSVYLEENSDILWDIVFDLPESIECRQRRATLRATPGEEHVKRIMLWSLPPVRGQTSPPIKEWGKPLLVSSYGKCSQLAIKDFSSTGIRLRVPKDEVYMRATRDTEFTTGRHYALLFTIDSQAGCGDENFLLIVRIQNQKLSDDMHFFDFGSQYVAISVPPKDANHEVQWRVLGEGGMVEKLAKWITNLALEEFRKAKASELE